MSCISLRPHPGSYHSQMEERGLQLGLLTPSPEPSPLQHVTPTPCPAGPSTAVDPDLELRWVHLHIFCFTSRLMPRSRSEDRRRQALELDPEACDTPTSFSSHPPPYLSPRNKDTITFIPERTPFVYQPCSELKSKPGGC